MATKPNIVFPLAPGVEERGAMRRAAFVGPMTERNIINGTQQRGPMVAPGPQVALPTPESAPAEPSGIMAVPLRSGPNALRRGAPAAVTSMMGKGWAPNALSRGAAPGASSALGGPVPVGRSRFDPTRMAETMVRRRDPRGAQFLFGRAMQEDGQEFQREMFGAQQTVSDAREERGYAHSDMMFGRQQEVSDAREQRRYDYSDMQFGRQQDAQKANDERDLQSRLAYLKEQQAQRGDPSQVRTVPVPGTKFVIPYAGNQPMGTLPIEGAEAPNMVSIPGTGSYVPMQDGRPVPNQPAYQKNPGWSVQGGPEYVPQQEMKEPKLPTIKREKDVTTRDPTTGKEVTTPGRDYYYEMDPATRKPKKIYVDEADPEATGKSDAPSWMGWLGGQTK